MFGYRPDGKKVKDIDPIQKLTPHIMVHRYDSQNLTHYECPCEPLDEFIKQEYEKGNSYTYMHILIAAIVRGIAKYPRLNRFIMNGRIYRRNDIEISFVVKKGFSVDAAEATVKVKFTGLESLAEVTAKVNEAINENNKMDADNGTDKIARLISYTPNAIIKLLIGLIKLLDKHGLLPQAIIDVSPFHTSTFVTNLKSIKGPSVFHHLYEFGNTGMFFAMGKEAMVPVVEGGVVKPGKRMPLDIVTDERFCDGFYFVIAMRYLSMLLGHPEQLVDPLEALVEDTTVIDSHKLSKQKKD